MHQTKAAAIKRKKRKSARECDTAFRTSKDSNPDVSVRRPFLWVVDRGFRGNKLQTCTVCSCFLFSPLSLLIVSYSTKAPLRKATMLGSLLTKVRGGEAPYSSYNDGGFGIEQHYGSRIALERSRRIGAGGNDRAARSNRWNKKIGGTVPSSTNLLTAASDPQQRDWVAPDHHSWSSATSAHNQHPTMETAQAPPRAQPPPYSASYTSSYHGRNRTNRGLASATTSSAETSYVPHHQSTNALAGGKPSTTHRQMTPAYAPAAARSRGATSDYQQPKDDIATRSYSVQYTPRYIPSAPSIPDRIFSPRSPAYTPVTSSDSWNNNSYTIDKTLANSGLQTPKYYHSSSSTLALGHQNNFSNNTSSRNTTTCPTSSSGERRQHKVPPRKRKANHQRKVRFHPDAGKDTNNKQGHPSSKLKVVLPVLPRKEEKERPPADGRIAYDPTQPQYSPRYRPDPTISDEEYARTYNPNYPQYDA